MSQIINTSSKGPAYLEAEKARELLIQGQSALGQGDLERGLELFEASCSLKPGDPGLYFEQGLSLCAYSTGEGREKVALAANKKFKIATTLLPEYFDAWHAWGKSLTGLGRHFGEFHYFLEAQIKLKKALECAIGVSAEILSDLQTEYGNVKLILAKKSGEACDWQEAIEAFEAASQVPSGKNASFWNQFGKACFGLTSLISDVKLCVKAIHCFKHAITQQEDSYEGWRLLAKAMWFLYEQTHDEDHFTQTNECFQTTTQINPLQADLWIDWALFLLESGKSVYDTKRLHQSIDNCRKAIALSDTPPPLALAYWGEAMSLIGELEENIDFLSQGQAKAYEALDLDIENPLIWGCLGETFSSYGSYFEDADYHYQAIEKFQEALSINNSHHKFWFAIGKNYALAGKFLQDCEVAEQSLRFIRKAIDLKPRISHYHYSYAVCLSTIGMLRQEKDLLDQAIGEFEQAIHAQKNSAYIHPDWLFQYAKTLDAYAEYNEEQHLYLKATEILSHVLMIDPDFPQIHYNLALTYSHLGELSEDINHFYRALHFFKLAVKHDEENDQILLDLAVTLMNISQYTYDEAERHTCYQDAETKLICAAKAGNLQAYYQLACLLSLQGQVERAMSFLFKANTFDALPYLDELLEDEWLDGVRDSSQFTQLLHELEKKESLQEDL